MSRLGVNIDHIATIRQARGTLYPDPISAAKLAELAGADAIVCHLREDRRHIQDEDVYQLKKNLDIPLTLEMALTEEMIRIACDVKPTTVCLVPEKREELTTEGGFYVKKRFDELKEALRVFNSKNIAVSVFIDPDEESIGLVREAGGQIIELHTGAYCEAHSSLMTAHFHDCHCELCVVGRGNLKRILHSAQFSISLGLQCNAGHGLDYSNISPLVSAFKENKISIHEYNIGHSIIARSLFTGIKQAVGDMKKLLTNRDNLL
ncbi:MAG: pyridoxine 5'-phosphate synthase [Deltaproteobacteria bacterium]|nr:pyridoxine 5'-phosphate synthase [Deltaproteobacteria bacterium]